MTHNAVSIPRFGVFPEVKTVECYELDPEYKSLREDEKKLKIVEEMLYTEVAAQCKIVNNARQNLNLCRSRGVNASTISVAQTEFKVADDEYKRLESELLGVRSQINTIYEKISVKVQKSFPMLGIDIRPGKA